MTCPACDTTAQALDHARATLGAVTRLALDAMLRGGRALDSETTDPQATAEDLLDRIGGIVATLTGAQVDRGPAGAVTLAPGDTPPRAPR